MVSFNKPNYQHQYLDSSLTTMQILTITWLKAGCKMECETQWSKSKHVYIVTQFILNVPKCSVEFECIHITFATHTTLNPNSIRLFHCLLPMLNLYTVCHRNLSSTWLHFIPLVCRLWTTVVWAATCSKPPLVIALLTHIPFSRVFQQAIEHFVLLPGTRSFERV